MALGQKLILKQGQSLVMTPQLQQAIKLLQMSSLELQSFVEAELERNPLLERDDGGEAKAAEPEKASEPAALDNTFSEPGTGGDSPTLDDRGELSDGSAGADEKLVAPGSQDSNWSLLRGSGSGSGGFDGDADDLMAQVSRELTLTEHLTSQLNLHIEGQAERAIGQYLIGMVNDAGYLVADLPAVCEQLGCAAEKLDQVLAILKSFEPTGVFARDLSECLKLQLKERDRLDPAMEALVSRLDLVAKRDFNQLKSICKVGLDDIRDMVAELKSLNPKPGLAFGSEPVVPVVPDVTVRAAPDGTWIVELNSEALPRVLMNNRYMTTVVRGAKSVEDKTFLSEAQAQASWLIKSLDQRARTILKVAREIVAQQDAFLVRGVQHLRPLTLKTVAESVSMHESTISRVTSNKYLSTPRGVFELKFFFTNAINAADGVSDGHSSEAVRHRIKELVARETVHAVLSDDTLVDLLRQDGIEIARRTVAKYRESLNIPSSVQRRREFRINP
jgi:RNA polymerase sigma-54 factor